MTTVRRLVPALAVVAALATNGCTLKKQDPPPFAGPSELSTSVTLSAAPDVVTQDGASQSVISIVARDSTAQPVRNLVMRAEISVNGVLTDFGRLSARTIATDSSGRASVVYTAPAAPLVSTDDNTMVSVLVTPIGVDYNNATTRWVTIRLVPPGVIIPPNTAPIADFDITPTSGVQGEKMTFDASPSTDPDGDEIVAWSWSFSDGDTRSGKVVQIAFDRPGTYAATLTVTDAGGLTGSTTKPFTVGQSTAPTASFTVSPTPVVIDTPVFFNATASQAGPGRTITSYAWNFGDGTTGTGVVVSHVFTSARTYVVMLTIRDDVGRSTTTTQTLTVGNAITADFTISPSTGPAATNFAFAATATSPGATIVSWSWDFGDSTPFATTQLATHTYAGSGTYTVRLTVTDSLGRTSVVTKTVIVT